LTFRSVEGFHASALRDLEGLLPLLRHAEPLAYGNRTNFVRHFKRYFDLVPPAYRKRAFTILV
jgi:AraC-like DNA-binding protein